MHFHFLEPPLITEIIKHQYLSFRYMVTRHLINGQGKAKPENGKVDENVKFRLRCSKTVNLREADGVLKEVDALRSLP